MPEYIVQPGDTLQSVARLFAIPTRRLIAINPSLLGRVSLEAGEALRIPSSAQIRPLIEVNGFVNMFADEEALQQMLAYLTYLSILGNYVMPDGSIAGPHNLGLILRARLASVAPLLVVSNIVEAKGFSAELGSTVLNSIDLQKQLIESIAAALKTFAYSGVMLDFEYIAPQDYLAYANFMRAVTWRLRPMGYMVLMNLRIDVLLERQAELAGVLPRPLYNAVADRFVVQTNEWACAPQVQTAQIDQAQQALDYMTSFISGQKIILGMLNCCYALAGGAQEQISLAQAEALAMRSNARIQIDTQTRASYFTYTDESGAAHTIWCGGVEDMRLALSLVNIYNLAGVSYRMLDQFPLSSYLTLLSMFEVRKLL